jgi:hypothetical protein
MGSLQRAAERNVCFCENDQATLVKRDKEERRKSQRCSIRAGRDFTLQASRNHTSKDVDRNPVTRLRKEKNFAMADAVFATLLLRSRVTSRHCDDT